MHFEPEHTVVQFLVKLLSSGPQDDYHAYRQVLHKMKMKQKSSLFSSGRTGEGANLTLLRACPQRTRSLIKHCQR